MKVDLVGKSALVTGAARGIGQSIADKLTANGASVVYTDVDFEMVKEAAANSPRSLALKMDISDESSVESTVGDALKQFGRIDIVVNNAGINSAKHRVNIDRFPLEEWEKIVKVDLTGTYLVSKVVARAMIQQRDGRIINIASVLGVVPARLKNHV